MARKQSKKFGWTIPVSIVFGVVIGAVLARNPWAVQRELRDERITTQAELAKTEKAHVEVIRNRAKQDSPTYQEQAARDKGYHKPNEVAMPSKPEKAAQKFAPTEPPIDLR